MAIFWNNTILFTWPNLTPATCSQYVMMAWNLLTRNALSIQETYLLLGKCSKGINKILFSGKCTCRPWSFTVNKLQYCTVKVLVPQGVNHWVDHSITAGNPQTYDT